MILMKKIILVTFFITYHIALAQSFEIVGNDTINYVDEQNLRQGFWIILNKIKKLPGYKEDAKVEEGNYKDSKKVGLWKQFYPSGRIKNEITYANNRPSGYARIYYENGNIMEEGMWENNRWVGTYKQYYESGNLYYDWKYNKEGKREGEQKYYYENGKLMIEGNWQDGKENGVIKEYYENGALKAERVFNDGTIDVAASKEYEPNGATHKLDGISLESSAATANKNKPKESAKEKNQPIQTTTTPSVTETAKITPPSEATENKTTTLPTSNNFPNEQIGTISDGYNKLYNSKRLLSKEGIFKNGKLWDGKELEYTGAEISKLVIYKQGKITETLTNKEDIQKALKQ